MIGRGEMSANSTAPRVPWSALLLVTGVALLVAVRLHLYNDEFANPDIAGIAYNADVLMAGGLPYRDTYEFKAPGTFFVFAGVFGTLGRDLGWLQLVYALWLLAGAPAIYLAAAAAYEHRRAPTTAPAFATAIYLLSAGQFDYNYSAWMMPAYAWAFAGLLQGRRSPSVRWDALAGFAAAAAFLLKRQAVVLGPVFLVVWWLRSRREPRGLVRAAASWLGGGALALLPLVALYGGQGELGTLLGGLFPWARAGAYAQADAPQLSAWVLGGQIVTQLWKTFPAAATMSVVALIAVARERRGPQGRHGTGQWWAPQVVLILLSVAAGGLGGARFYLHYLVQYLPGLAILAAHPAVVRWLRDAWCSAGLHRALWVALTAAVGVPLAYQVLEIAAGKAIRYDALPRRLEHGKTAAQATGQYIQAHTVPGETVFVWGWTAWRAYFWAGRFAPTRVYKPMGAITTFNTNSTFFDSQPIVFTPGALADEVEAALRERPPAYFIHSPSYVDAFGCAKDPLYDWTGVAELLEKHYRLEAAFGDLRLFGLNRSAKLPLE